MKNISWLLLPLIGLGFTVQSAHAEYASQRVSHTGHGDRPGHDSRQSGSSKRDHDQDRRHYDKRRDDRNVIGSRHDRRHNKHYDGGKRFRAKSFAHDRNSLHFNKHGYHHKHGYYNRYYDRHYWRNAHRQHQARHKYNNYRYSLGFGGYAYNPRAHRHNAHCRH